MSLDNNDFRRQTRRRIRRHYHRRRRRKQEARVALVGNANVGKSVIFSRFTGKYASVSNYPGTTVEVSRGTSIIDGHEVEIIDTPGISSLLAASEDEEVARRIILDENTTTIVQVADAKNLRRALHLALQLAETGLPQVLTLNMMDEAEKVGISIDFDTLSLLLGIPVVPTVAIEGKGIPSLRKHSLDTQRPSIKVLHPTPIENALDTLEEMINDFTPYPRVIASLILMDEPVSKLIKGVSIENEEAIEQIVTEVANSFPDPISLVMMKSYADKAQQIMDIILTIGERRTTFADRLSDATIHPIIGTFIFAAVLVVTFAFVGYLGAGILVDLVEGYLFEDHINPWITDIVEDHVPFASVREILVGEYGMITVGITLAIAVVLPIVMVFFFTFALLEDSGYMPRLALMGNRLLSKVGLNGKAVIPLVLGTGCGAMAIMSTRILETKRERVIATLLLALGIPCSAQLAVIIGLMTYISPLGALVVFGVVFSQLLLIAYLANLVLPGETSDFILEIPPLRMPKISNTLMKTWIRMEWFLTEAVPVFLVGSLLVSLANIVEIGDASLLDHIINAGEPIVGGLLGLPEDTVVDLMLGFLRKDYGAAGFFDLAHEGKLTNAQLVVGSVVLILFVPCIAAFFMIVKEHGVKVALGTIAFIIPFSIAIGSILHLFLNLLEVPV